MYITKARDVAMEECLSNPKVGYYAKILIRTLSKSFTRLASIEELFSYSSHSSWISSAEKE